MIGFTDITIIVAINLVTTPPMTTPEIIDAFNSCRGDVVITQNMKGKIIKVKCDG